MKSRGHKDSYDMIRKKGLHQTFNAYGYERYDGPETVTFSAIRLSVNHETDLVKRPMLMLNTIYARLVTFIKSHSVGMDAHQSVDHGVRSDHKIFRMKE